eukprot:TRINITY_DN2414_c0_g1_i1.p1 TRINITY_DN2414_c0_g1~~TRINITY_DN2414_c0_g1_i1.p1  ORF type:complete len:643 (+),score=168.20 TRINITY_DN2414_c0_g1_i1:97-2025(+)
MSLSRRRAVPPEVAERMHLLLPLLKKMLHEDLSNLGLLPKALSLLEEEQLVPVIVMGLKQMGNVFCRLLDADILLPLPPHMLEDITKDGKEDERALHEWCNKQRERFFAILGSLMAVEDPLVTSTTLRIAMKVCKHELAVVLRSFDERSRWLKLTQVFRNGVFGVVVVPTVVKEGDFEKAMELITQVNSGEMPDAGDSGTALSRIFLEEYVGKYIDVLHATLRGMLSLMNTFASSHLSLVNVYHLMRYIGRVHDEGGWIPDGRKNGSKRRKISSEANDLALGGDVEVVDGADDALDCFSRERWLIPFGVEDDEIGGKRSNFDIRQYIPAKMTNGRSLRKAFEETLIEYVRYSAKFPRRLLKSFIGSIDVNVMPHILSPIVLMDFLKDTYKHGGILAIRALRGIFMLMTQHRLEYPKFYEKVYALLRPEIMRMNDRSEFFSLLDIFLSSPMLPAYIAAAFAKRIARLALFSPVSGQLVALPFIHSILARHTACLRMIHSAKETDSATRVGREGWKKDSGDGHEGDKCEDDGDDAIRRAVSLDPFDVDDDNLETCRALESSLWEVETMRNHYLPLVCFRSEMFTKEFRPHRLGKFDAKMASQDSYATLLSKEIEHVYHKQPALEFEHTKHLIEKDIPLVDHIFQ